MRFLAALALLCAPMAAFAECAVDAVELRGDWGTAKFRVEVADEPDERSVGLMNRPNMARTAGMLFIYERPQRATFWMRNTLIPLDMIFADPTGTVTRVHENAIPLDETTIDGGRNVLYVLEINGGMAAQMGIAPGTEMRHPQIDGTGVVWPCE